MRGRCRSSWIAVASIVCVPLFASASERRDPSVRSLDAGLVGKAGEFSITIPRDLGSRAGEWVYAIRYFEFSSVDDPFGFTMIRRARNADFEILLFEDEELGGIGRRSPGSRRPEPDAAVAIDEPLADLLYRVWIRALERAVFGGRENATGPYFYISAFDAKSDFMSAETQIPQEGRPTGDLVEIARLTRKLIQGAGKASPERDDIPTRVREACERFLALYPPPN